MLIINIIKLIKKTYQYVVRKTGFLLPFVSNQFFVKHGLYLFKDKASVKKPIFVVNVTVLVKKIDNSLFWLMKRGYCHA